MQLKVAGVIAILVATAGAAAAQTPFDGEWSSPGGVRLTLKTDVAGVTGTVTEGAGAGGSMSIEQGSVSGRTARFTTTRTVNGNTVTTTWTADLTDDDTIALSRMADVTGGADGRGRAGRDGRAGAGAGAARGRGGAGPRAGGRGERGGGRAGRAGARGGGTPDPEAGEPTSRGGREGRAGGESRGRAGGAGGDRGRGEARGSRGAGAARGGDRGGGGFPEILRRVR
jgi:hypothetical protein